MTTTIKLLGYQQVSGQVECLTGLRVGASNDVIEIGGLDNPVIKHPITREPYIPGSSIKGKMRSLLEMTLGLVEPNGAPHKRNGECGLACPVCRIFGVGAGGESPFGPGRLIVRDATLPAAGLEGSSPSNGRRAVTEIKWENVINRIKGSAENPRPMERVPAGTFFNFEMSYRVFDVGGDEGTTDKHLFDHVLKGLRWIELDAMGGSGSRGYGRVSFGTVKVTYLDGSEEEKRVAELKV